MLRPSYCVLVMVCAVMAFGLPAHAQTLGPVSFVPIAVDPVGDIPAAFHEPRP